MYVCQIKHIIRNIGMILWSSCFNNNTWNISLDANAPKRPEPKQRRTIGSAQCKNVLLLTYPIKKIVSIVYTLKFRCLGLCIVRVMDLNFNSSVLIENVFTILIWLYLIMSNVVNCKGLFYSSSLITNCQRGWYKLYFSCVNKELFACEFALKICPQSTL